MNDMSVKIEQLLKLQKGVCEQYEKTTPTFIPLSWKSLTEDMEPDLCIRLPYFN